MRERYNTNWLPDDLKILQNAHTDPRVLEMQQAAMEIAEHTYTSGVPDDMLAYLLIVYGEKYAGLMKQEVCVEGELYAHQPDSVKKIL